jgi:hypothetical protein
MNNDSKLQSNFQNATKWKPLLYATEVSVLANECVFSLTKRNGFFNSKRKRMIPERGSEPNCLEKDWYTTCNK